GHAAESRPVPVTLEDGTSFDLDHGRVVIAAITSCTNTSNPSVMIGAALLAKNAVDKGLTRKPWVKTSLAPGSKVVMDYYDRAGLTPYLEKLGFNLVGYGCTTCIGNSGPLPEEVSKAVNDHDLAVTSVLSGNRNFEGRINPDVKMNYLASPPLVVAYALAGNMNVDITRDPLGVDADGNPVTVSLDGNEFELDHGAVVIAAITSCTNTTNPSVMIGAALVAKKAVEKGLTRKPWVKSTLAPGSKVVTDYFDKAGLTPYLEKLGFDLVGYGCTTCIGNSGPLIPEVSQAVNDNDLAVVSVLSGNRNFEGRINPDVKMNYLASPPLVVAYALAGSMDVDITTEPLGQDSDGNDVFLKDIWPSSQEIQEVVDSAIASEMFSRDYADVFAGDERWRDLPTPQGDTFEWDADSTYVRRPPYFDGMAAEPDPVTDIQGARVLAKLGDSVTTDHISPAGSIKPDSPAGQYLQEHGVARRDFNSYGSRRGNHEVMIRGTFANIRLRNQLAPGTEGGFTRDFTAGGEVTTIYDAAQHYAAAGTPLVILAGKEYGSGSSRDWAAKGTSLLGVRAVIAESYERIHRSNLIGMGVLPLQFADGDTAESLGLTGEETFSITGVTELNEGRTPREVTVNADGKEFKARLRIDTPGEADYYRHGGIMQYVLRSLLRS
ncbi:MAG TPA: aconitate hydratase AcnA, partial [Actinomycetes bacterium]